MDKSGAQKELNRLMRASYGDCLENAVKDRDAYRITLAIELPAALVALCVSAANSSKKDIKQFQDDATKVAGSLVSGNYGNQFVKRVDFYVHVLDRTVLEMEWAESVDPSDYKDNPVAKVHGALMDIVYNPSRLDDYDNASQIRKSKWDQRVFRKKLAMPTYRIMKQFYSDMRSLDGYYKVNSNIALTNTTLSGASGRKDEVPVFSHTIASNTAAIMNQKAKSILAGISGVAKAGYHSQVFYDYAKKNDISMVDAARKLFADYTNLSKMINQLGIEHVSVQYEAVLNDKPLKKISVYDPYITENHEIKVIDGRAGLEHGALNKAFFEKSFSYSDVAGKRDISLVFEKIYRDILNTTEPIYMAACALETADYKAIILHPGISKVLNECIYIGMKYDKDGTPLEYYTDEWSEAGEYWFGEYRENGDYLSFDESSVSQSSENFEKMIRLMGMEDVLVDTTGVMMDSFISPFDDYENDSNSDMDEVADIGESNEDSTNSNQDEDDYLINENEHTIVYLNDNCIDISDGLMVRRPVTICKECGAMLGVESNFCNICGAVLNEGMEERE